MQKHHCCFVLLPSSRRLGSIDVPKGARTKLCSFNSANSQLVCSWVGNPHSTRHRREPQAALSCLHVVWRASFAITQTLHCTPTTAKANVHPQPEEVPRQAKEQRQCPSKSPKSNPTSRDGTTRAEAISANPTILLESQIGHLLPSIVVDKLNRTRSVLSGDPTWRPLAFPDNLNL